MGRGSSIDMKRSLEEADSDPNRRRGEAQTQRRTECGCGRPEVRPEGGARWLRSHGMTRTDGLFLGMEPIPGEAAVGMVEMTAKNLNSYLNLWQSSSRRGEDRRRFCKFCRG